MSSCFRALALHSVACIANFEFGKFSLKVPLDPTSNSAGQSPLCQAVNGPAHDEPGPCSIVLVLLGLALRCFPGFILRLKAVMADWQAYFKKSSIVAVFYLIPANYTPSATAADDFPVMKFNLLQTRKRCKRPSAKRAPGRHLGARALSNITAFQSTLSGRRFPRSRGATNVLV